MKKGIQFQRLEDRILFSATPAAHGNVPTEVKLHDAAKIHAPMDTPHTVDGGHTGDTPIDSSALHGKQDLADSGSHAVSKGLAIKKGTTVSSIKGLTPGTTPVSIDSFSDHSGILPSDFSSFAPQDGSAGTSHQRNELLILDGSLPNADVLAASMAQEHAAGTNVQILILNPAQDGLTQITAYLDTQSGLGVRYDALHIASHAQEGRLELGNVSYDTEDFAAGQVAAEQVSHWSAALIKGGDILLYGCDLGGGATGAQFIKNLSEASGADVAASTDQTGSKSLGGNWTLEVASGSIQTSVLSAQFDTLLAPTALVTVDAPENPFTGESFGVDITFDNNSGTATDAGYGPFVDLRVSAGLDVVGGAFTYLGQPVTVLGSFENNTGLPMTFTHPISQISDLVGPNSITLAPGEQYFVLELPFGSFVPDQPASVIHFNATTDKTELPASYLPNQAGTQGTVSFQVGGGYRYGADALDNPGTDAPIYTAPLANNEDGDAATGSASTDEIRPRIWEVTKSLQEKETEAATGPNDPQTWTIVVDVATGETVTNIDITDVLANHLVYVSGSATISVGGVTYAPVSSAPNNSVDLANNTTGLPGADGRPDNAFLFEIPTVTGAAGTDVTISYQTYVPYLDANGAQVLSPSTGNDRSIPNSVDALGSYDPDGAGGIAPYTIADSATGDDLLLPNIQNLSAESLTIQKQVSDINGGTFVAGDTLGWTLDFQVSDYFQFNDLFLVDKLGDGQLFIDGSGAVVAGAIAPTFTWTENGTNFSTTFSIASPSADLSPITDVAEINFGNFVVFYNGTTSNQTFNASAYEPDASSAIVVGAGETVMLFRISEQMIAAGGDAILRGDGLVGSATFTPGMTAAQLNSALAANIGNGQTSGKIVFRSVVQRNFITGPSGDVSIDMGDAIDNTVSIDGRILDNTTNADQGREDDGSGAGIEINGPTLTKAVLAIAGDTGYATPIVGAGESVTWGLGVNLSVAAVEELTIDDYVPLPKFLVSEFNGTGSAVDILSDVTVFSKSIFDALPAASKIPPAGKLFVVLGDDVFTALGGAITGATSNSVSNSFSINVGTFDLDPSTASLAGNRQVDVYFSLSATDAPMTDGLFLTNQQQTSYQDTGTVTGVGEAIVQVQVEEPVVDILKGVVASTQGGGLTLGGIGFNGVAGSGFTGTVATATQATAIGASNLTTGVLPDGGDVVRYAIVVQNTGRADAFDVTVRDSIDYASFFDTNPDDLNLIDDKTDFMNATKFEVRLGNGTLLIEGVDYVLTYNADSNPATGDFQIELTDGVTGKLAEGKLSNGTPILTGLNTIVVTYDLTLASNIAATQSYTNTATLTKYTGLEIGGINRVPGGDTDTAIITTDAPDLTKTLVSSEIVTADNTNTEAVVGEIVTYDITVRVPEGTVNALQVFDALSSELGFVRVVSVTSSAGISTTNTIPNGTNTIDGSNFVSLSGNQLTFNLGTTTNANADNSTDEFITIRLETVVRNVSSNQAGTTATNQAHLSYDPGAVGTGDGSAALATTSDVPALAVTIIEPTLTLLKQVQNVTDAQGPSTSVRGDAGDIIRYTITITNNNAGSDTAAYELTLSDVIPAQLPVGSLSIFSVSSTGTVNVGAGTLASNFQITPGGVLQTTAGANIDLQIGSSITIVVQGTFSGATGNIIPNTAEIRWTSLDADPGNRAIGVADGVQRGGQDGLLGAGSLNDYRQNSVANISSPSLVNKVIVDSSQTATTGSNVAIGEVIRYRLITTLAEGSAANFQIMDNLGNGLEFLNDGSATFAFISTGGTDITSTAITNISAVTGGGVSGSAAQMLSLTSAGMTGLFADNNISTAIGGTGTGDLTVYTSGQDVFFRFGDLVNSDNDVDNEYVVIEFNVLIANIAGNQAGTALTNNYSVLVDTTGSGTPTTINVVRDADGNGVINGVEGNSTFTTSNTVTETVVEPNLAVNKLITATTGSVVTYRLSLTNTGANTATAFNSIISDALDGVNLTLVGGSPAISTTGGVTGISNTSTGNTVSFNIDQIPVGATVTITYQANVLTTPTGLTTLNNTANATTTSLDGTSISGPFYGTLAGTLGAPGASTGERTGADGVGGALNDYASADTEKLGSIGDRVWFDADGNGAFNGPDIGIPNAAVTIRWAGIDGIFGNGDDSVITTNTNSSGFYSVTGLPVDSAGQFRVTVDTTTTPFTTFGLVQTFDADGVGTANSSTLSLITAAPNPLTQDFGYRGNASLGDRIWHDQDGDGVQDAGEQGIPSVTVNALWLGFDGVVGGGDDVAYTTVTSGTGSYGFATLPAGNFVVSIDTTTLPDNLTQTFDLDGTGSANSTAVSLTPAQNRTDVDFAYNGNGTIGDKVWYDVDGDGTQNNAEPGIAGATVTLVFGGDDGNLATTVDNITYTTTTDSTGTYTFTGLFGGDINGANPNYRVTVTPPAGYTTQTFDADGTGTANQSSLQLANAGTNLTQDFGYRGAGTQGIGDFVWSDLNGNGRQDGGEPGISGVAVSLLDAAGNVLATTTTNGSGAYAFNNLVQSSIFGDYRVAFVAPVGMVFSAKDSAVATDANDSDADVSGPTNGRTGTISVLVGTLNSTVDAGLYTPVSLGNRVFYDVDGDGVQDAGEVGLSGVDVQVVWLGLDGVAGGGDDQTFTTVTGANGIWSVATLPPGSYRVTTSNFPAGFNTVTDSIDNGGAPSAVNPVTISTTSGVNRTDIDFGLRGTGSIGDRIWHDQDSDGVQDVGEQGIANVTVNLTWHGQDGVAGGGDDVTYTTVTDGNGNYVISTLPAGNFTVSIDTTTLPDSFTQTFDLDGTGTANTTAVTLTPGQTRTDVDFAYTGNSTIGDRVWFDADGDGVEDPSESGLYGITVTLVFGGDDGDLATTADNITYTTTTDANGNYSFTGLFGGDINGGNPNYRVTVTPPAGATQTYDSQGALDNISELQLPATTVNNNQDFGYRGSASLGDRVWNDRDADGVQDVGEFGIPGLTVNIYRDLNGDGDLNDPGEGLFATTTTGTNGAYSFTNLLSGTYFVEIANLPASTTQTYDLDGTGTPNIASRTLGTNTNATDVDFGYQGSASLGDYVWFDADSDGVQDASEPPIPGVRVFLDIDGNGVFDAATDPSAVTNASGFYSITGLIGGTYTARIDVSTLPPGYVATFDRDGAATPDVTTIVLAATANLTDVDWGYIGTLGISGRSYHDLDKNGAFDGTDTGLGGVTIELISDTNNDGVVDGGDFVVYTTTTGPNGTYSFATVISGNYLIRETQLGGYGSLENNTNLIDLTVNGVGIANQNFGNTTGSLSGTVYHDQDDSAVQNGGEPGIAGVSVKLDWSGADNVFGNSDDRSVTVITDANGNYTFDYSNTAGFVSHGDSTRGLSSLGTYRISETQPSVFIDGADAAGNASVENGTITAGTAPAGRGADSVTGIQIGVAQDSTGYNFGEISPSRIAGSVHVDRGNDGVRGPLEKGIPGSIVTLTGTDLYGRPVSLTTTTNAFGDFDFDNLYASDNAGYTLTQTKQPRGYRDGLEGVGTNGGTAGVEVINGIVLGTNVTATDYTFGEIRVPLFPGGLFVPVESIPIANESVLSSYFYDTFENFRDFWGVLDDEEDDTEYLLDPPGNEQEPLLSIMPMYSGHAEAGSTIVLEIKNVRGAVIGTETIVADAGGNWLAKFPNSIVFDTPTTVSQTVTRASYSESPDDEFNFRTNFAPAINPSHFFTEPLDVEEVMSRNADGAADESLEETQNFEWSGFNYEFLAEPGVPSS